ncbi:MAG TPA: hypothetical protein VJT73_13015 [Polyangiaceae bacterium]|nr:hypothetical protein [Polyangiaceae bacterium]
MTRLRVILATVIALLTVTHNASAQRLMSGGGIGLGTGLERSDDLQDKLFRRARTRIVVPFDFRIDEDMSQGIGVVALFEVEPHVSLGAELRYMRWLGRSFVGFAGVTSVIAPRSLLGVDVGADIYIPFGKSGVSLFIEPSLAALPLGSDLPQDRVLLWLLLSAGIHANF